MQELAEVSGETVSLCVLSGHEVVYIEKVEGSSSSECSPVLVTELQFIVPVPARCCSRVEP